MIVRFRAHAPFAQDGGCRAFARLPSNRPEALDMKWETPQAIDFRFGMEITMYIAHR
jgi:coenzyme PQQ precursor peptide PqqA